MKILSKLKLLFTPTDEWDAVNKKYVDDAINNITIPDDVNDADLSNYLAKDNTESFFPVSDYNPATKKYVDETISDVIGDLGKILDAINRTVI